MSGFNASPETVDRPVDMTAAEFVERRDSPSWTAAQEHEFTLWLDENPVHRVAFMRLNASWKRTERLAALRAPEFQRPYKQAAPNIRWTSKLAVLAIFSIVLAGAAGAYFSAPRYDTYATTVGGHETLSLHDGSKIELNTDTLVRISQTPKQRLVVLEKGEAYFQVRHEQTRPFIVVTRAGRIVDLGTKFAVRSDDQRLKVSLIEGSVRVELKEGPRKRTTLSSGDVLLASAGSVSVTTTPLTSLNTTLAWRKGMLVFHETSLLNAAREFNRYNEIRIVIDDPRAGHETINGALPANDLEEFERMAKNLFGLRARKHANELIFSR